VSSNPAKMYYYSVRVAISYGEVSRLMFRQGNGDAVIEMSGTTSEHIITSRTSIHFQDFIGIPDFRIAGCRQEWWLKRHMRFPKGKRKKVV
jgi:hypothetical protein